MLMMLMMMALHSGWFWWVLHKLTLSLWQKSWECWGIWCVCVCIISNCLYAGTIGSLTICDIVDFSMGMTSPKFHSYACDHSLVITMSVWVGFHHGGTGNKYLCGRHFYVHMGTVSSIGKVGWGGMGHIAWVGVMSECSVVLSYEKVMTHSFSCYKGGGVTWIGSCELRYTHIPWKVYSLSSVHWFSLLFYGSKDFLLSCYNLTWFSHGSAGIEGMSGGWTWSDSLDSLVFCFFVLSFSAASMWKGCKPSLDAFYVWLMVLFLMHNCLAYMVHLGGVIYVWDSYSLCMLGCTPSMLKSFSMLVFSMCEFWFWNQSYSFKGIWENASRVSVVAVYVIGVMSMAALFYAFLWLWLSAGGFLGLGFLGFKGKGMGVYKGNEFCKFGSNVVLSWGLCCQSVLVRFCGSGSGFWKSNTMYVIDKGLKMLGLMGIVLINGYCGIAACFALHGISGSSHKDQFGIGMISGYNHSVSSVNYSQVFTGSMVKFLCSGYKFSSKCYGVGMICVSYLYVQDSCCYSKSFTGSRIHVLSLWLFCLDGYDLKVLEYDVITSKVWDLLVLSMWAYGFMIGYDLDMGFKVLDWASKLISFSSSSDCFCLVMQYGL